MHLEVVDGEPPILFLHGGGVSGWMWEPLRARLDPAVGALVPDLPGHGASFEETYTGHESAVAAIAAVVRQRAPSGVHVVGFSLGAQLAILLASMHPDLVRTAVIVSGETIPAPMPRATLALLRWTSPLARNERFARAQARQLGVPQPLMDEYIRDSSRISLDTLLNSVAENIRFTLPAEWSAFSGGVTVVVGEHERGLMRRSARHTHESLPGSELAIVPGSAHDVPFTSPDALAGIIRAVIRQA